VESSDSSNEPVLGRVQAEQRKDPELCKLIKYLKKAELPEDYKEAIYLDCYQSQSEPLPCEWCAILKERED